MPGIYTERPGPLTVTQMDPEQARRRQFYKPWTAQMLALRAKQEPGITDAVKLAESLKGLYGPDTQIDPNELVEAAQGLLATREPPTIRGKEPGSWAYQGALQDIGSRRKFDARVQAREAAKAAALGGDVESVRRILGRQDVYSLGVDRMTKDGPDVALWKLGETVMPADQLAGLAAERAERSAVAALREIPSEEVAMQQPRPRLPQGKPKPFEPKPIGGGAFVIGYETDAQGRPVPIVHHTEPQGPPGVETKVYEWGVVTIRRKEDGSLAQDPDFRLRKQEAKEPQFKMSMGTYRDQTGKERYGLWSFKEGTNDNPTLIQELTQMPEAGYRQELYNPKTGKTTWTYFDKYGQAMVDEDGEPIVPVSAAGGRAPSRPRLIQSHVPMTDTAKQPLMVLGERGVEPASVPIDLFEYDDGSMYSRWGVGAADYLRGQAVALRDAAPQIEKGYMAGTAKVEANPERAKAFLDHAARLEAAAKGIEAGTLKPAQPAPLPETGASEAPKPFSPNPAEPEAYRYVNNEGLAAKIRDLTARMNAGDKKAAEELQQAVAVAKGRSGG